MRIVNSFSSCSRKNSPIRMAATFFNLQISGIRDANNLSVSKEDRARAPTTAPQPLALRTLDGYAPLLTVTVNVSIGAKPDIQLWLSRELSTSSPSRSTYSCRTRRVSSCLKYRTWFCWIPPRMWVLAMSVVSVPPTLQAWKRLDVLRPALVRIFNRCWTAHRIPKNSNIKNSAVL